MQKIDPFNSHRKNRMACLVITVCLMFCGEGQLRAGDSDADYMDDDWEVSYGLDPHDATDAMTDLDQDGFVNLSEYLHHSVPNDSTAVPITNISMTVPQLVPTIQRAIDLSIHGDTVVISPGTYHEAIDFSGHEIELTSTDPDDAMTVGSTVITPPSSAPAVLFRSGESSNTRIEGLTLTGGQTGVSCYGSVSPIISKCVIVANTSNGVYIQGTSNTTVSLDQCRIIGNGAQGSAGIVCRYSTLVLTHSVVAKNGTGGSTAVYLAYGSAGLSKIMNCTITEHTNRGIRCYSTGSHSPDIRNCILWNNGDDLVDCSATYSCIQDGDPGLGNMSVDPQFREPGADDYHLSQASLCLDAGAPWTDYSNEPTPNGERVNIGMHGGTAQALTSNDIDQDGLSDNWEAAYWPGDNLEDHDPNDDPDQDMFSNRTEYLYGYDPTVSTDAGSEIIHAEVFPQTFDPTEDETVLIQYWINKESLIHMKFVAQGNPDSVINLPDHRATVGSTQIPWDGKNNTGLIAKRGLYDLVVDLDDGFGNVTTKRLPSAVNLNYYHRIDAAYCNPQRILPLNNEVMKITYRAAKDEDVVINILDSEGQLLRSFPIAGSDSNEVVLHGTDLSPDNPERRYLSNQEDYSIEVAYQGMEETKQALNTHVKKEQAKALAVDSMGLLCYMYSQGTQGYHFYSTYNPSTRTIVTIGYYGRLPIDNPEQRWTTPGPSLPGLRERIKLFHDNDPCSIDLAAKQAFLDAMESGGLAKLYRELGWAPGHVPTAEEQEAMIKMMVDKFLPNWDVEEGVGWINKDAIPTGGDPVNLSSGEFWLAVTDLTLSGRMLPVHFVRTYGSQRQYNGRFGYGWDMNYNMKVRRLLDPNVAVYLDGQGNKREYLRSETDPSIFTRDQDLSHYLYDSGDAFTLMTKPGLEYHFDPNGNLARICDENSNTITLTYDSRGLLPIKGFSGAFLHEDFDGPDHKYGIVAMEYQLNEITDDLGRVTTLSYDANGLLETLTDFANRTWVYTYDPLSNDLLTVQDPNGNTTTYTYGFRHNLLEITDPSGQIYTANDYDFDDRVVSQAYGDGVFTFLYHDDAQEVTVIDREGGVRRTELNQQGQMVSDTVFTADDHADPNAFAVTHAFNDHANIVRTTWPAGNCVDTEYDTLGNITAIFRKASTSDPNNASDPNVLATAFAYDPNHIFKVRTITDPEGNVTTYDYDEIGNVIRITYPSVGPHTPVMQYTYNRYGQLDTRTMPDGSVTKYLYYDDTNDPNNHGRLWQVVTDYGTDPNCQNITSQFEYDQIGHLIKTTDPNGNTARFEYNHIDQLVNAINADNHETLFGYNENKKLAWTRAPINDVHQVTRYTYDVLDHVKTVTGPLGYVTENTYTKNEDPNGVTDAEGHSTEIVYNTRGLVWKALDANGGVTEYTYDENGNVTQIQDARGNVTHYTYDRFDSLIRTTYEGSTYQEVYYNRNNQVTRRINRAGEAIEYQYDALGRMTVKDRPHDPNIEFAYDIAGRLTDVNDGADTIQYTYDRLGRTASVTDADSRTVSYEYNTRGLRTKMTYPGVAILSGKPPRPEKPKRPENGRTRTLATKNEKGKGPPKKKAPKTEPGPKKGKKPEQDKKPKKGKKPKQPKKPKSHQGGQQTEAFSLVYSYDALGRIEKIITDNNDVLAEYSYDELSRRTQLTLGNGASVDYQYDLGNRLTELSNHISSADAITFEYADYDKMGNRLSAKANTDPAQVYTYDNRYQLTLVDYNDGNATAYGYDTVGNRSHVNDGNVTLYLSNSLNQYTAMGGVPLSYDTNGNLTGSGGNTYYEYDCENRLTRVFDQNGDTVASYAYDYLGRRIQKTVYGSPDVVTKYAYDGDQVIAEYDDSGTLLRRFIYGPGIDEPICMVDAADNGTVYYYHLDGLGSVVALSDVNNVIVERYSYSVFGEPSQVSDVNNPYLFTGRRFDPETRLYHYRARAYAYDIGRFLQTDPIGYADGINWYTYCGNNPVGLVDPFGLCKGDGAWAARLDVAQGILDAGGMLPAVGVIPDAANAAISALRGNWGDAAFSAGAMLPVLGQGSTAAKWAKRGASHADEAIGLGKRGKVVIGKNPDYKNLASEIGAKRFNVPTDIWNKMSKAEQWAANRKFLDRMIQRGDEIILSNPVRKIDDVSGVFRQEIDYLVEQGFQLSGDGASMIR